jgi:tetraprenyl-beta-curcumene synthase
MQTTRRHSYIPAEAQYTQNTGVNQARLLWHYINHTLPQVKHRLNYWRNQAQRCVDDELRSQALASIAGKDFHCQGGAILAAPYADQEEPLLDFIVAYQTLCDYLDNLCDRANCLDGRSFRKLHESLLHAISPESDIHDYYQTYPYKQDNSYITKLVEQCRSGLIKLPSYNAVKLQVIQLAKMYIDLQVKKHIDWAYREKTLIDWASSHLYRYPGVWWNEFAAATGSTLAIFALIGLSTRQQVTPQDVVSTVSAYFPWICGLHILLDYFIDQEEDRLGGDLNFTFYYRDRTELMERLAYFVRGAHHQAAHLNDPVIVRTVVEGLLAMYFSDPKVKIQGIGKESRELIRESGQGAIKTYYLCSMVRKFF